MIHRSETVRQPGCNRCYVGCKIKAYGVFQDCVFIDCVFIADEAINTGTWDCVFFKCKGTQNLRVINDTTPKWAIVWSKDYITIGCKKYTVSEWGRMSDKAISDMSPYALRWWRKHKAWVLEKHKEYYDI